MMMAVECIGLVVMRTTKGAGSLTLVPQLPDEQRLVLDLLRERQELLRVVLRSLQFVLIVPRVVSSGIETDRGATVRTSASLARRLKSFSDSVVLRSWVCKSPSVALSSRSLAATPQIGRVSEIGRAHV